MKCCIAAGLGTARRSVPHQFERSNTTRTKGDMATWKAFLKSGTLLVWRRAGGSSVFVTGMVALGRVSDCGLRRVNSTFP